MFHLTGIWQPGKQFLFGSKLYCAPEWWDHCFVICLFSLKIRSCLVTSHMSNAPVRVPRSSRGLVLMRFVNFLFFLDRERLPIFASALWGPGPLHKGMLPAGASQRRGRISPKLWAPWFLIGLKSATGENVFYTIATTGQMYVKDLLCAGQWRIQYL